jgi:hypothetical protein
MTETTDTIAFRCGKATKAGTACRTPVVHPDAACANHRPAKAAHKNSAHGNQPGAETTKQNLVAAFIENYQCADCHADVRLFADGAVQLILIAHAATCPRIVERVKRVAA